MPISINTNMASIITQSNLNSATKSLNDAIERMSSGYKINHASDNAAGYSITKNWETKLSSLDVAADNAATGADMLTTMEDNYDLISSHLSRVRDLTEQAANGTYATSSKQAIQAEITARLEEINRIASNCEFNGVKLMDGTQSSDINLQVGIDSSANSRICLESSLFDSAKVDGLFTGETTATLAEKCAGLNSGATAASMLDTLDDAINEISTRVTKIGAGQNRIDSAIDAIEVQSENLTSSLSTLKDADVAEESSKYVQAQILQQVSATLLATANSQPSIALSLI